MGKEELFIIQNRKQGGSLSASDVQTVTTGIWTALNLMMNNSAFFACLPILASDCIAQLIYQTHLGCDMIKKRDWLVSLLHQGSRKVIIIFSSRWHFSLRRISHVLQQVCRNIDFIWGGTFTFKAWNVWFEWFLNGSGVLWKKHGLITHSTNNTLSAHMMFLVHSMPTLYCIGMNCFCSIQNGTFQNSEQWPDLCITWLHFPIYYGVWMPAQYTT